MSLAESINIKNLDELIEHYKPFIIRITSEFTGRYISVENDDEFSIALFAFAKAVECYQEEKGNFLTFARIVIERRLMNYQKSENNKKMAVSLDQLMDMGIEFSKTKVNENIELQDEIDLYCQDLRYFGLDLDTLANFSPKHRDTRNRAIDIAEACSLDKPIVKSTYRKKKLPIRAVSRLTLYSEKIIKTSKIFILATMIIFVKDLKCLIQWIMETRCHDVS